MNKPQEPAQSQAEKKAPKATPELLFAKRIATDICSDKGIRYASAGGVLHEWNGIYWSPMLAEEAERMAWEWLSAEMPERATPKTACACVAAAAIAAKGVPARLVSSENVVIPLLNGYLNLKSTGKDDGNGGKLWERKLNKPSRDYGMTFALDCDYKNSATANEFMKFLNQVLPDPDVRHYVQEYAGYTLMPDSRFQRAQFWLGGGANGKSTLAEIISALHEKVAAMELDALDGFNLVNLMGASLVYVDETPKRINEQRLKMLISGGLVQVDRKFRDPINLRPTAKWIICGNDLPSVSDQTAGFWRRLAIIPFTQSFQDGLADPLLSRRIIDNELPGVLNWALGGLQRLLERGRFGVMPAAVLDAVAGGKRETNSVLSWYMNLEIEHTEEAATPKDEVLQCYRQWCMRNGMSAVGVEKFWKRLASITGVEFPEVKKTINGKRQRVVPVRIPQDDYS